MLLANYSIKTGMPGAKQSWPGNDLTLTPENGGDALRFERQEPPRLEGVEWEVTGYNNGQQAVVSPKVGTRLTLMSQDGQVSGSSGCNSFQGAFTVAENALTIHPQSL
jgi:heat shock protein HslJ